MQTVRSSTARTVRTNRVRSRIINCSHYCCLTSWLYTATVFCTARTMLPSFRTKMFLKQVRPLRAKQERTRSPIPHKQSELRYRFQSILVTFVPTKPNTQKPCCLTPRELRRKISITSSSKQEQTHNAKTIQISNKHTLHSGLSHPARIRKIAQDGTSLTVLRLEPPNPSPVYRTPLSTEGSRAMRTVDACNPSRSSFSYNAQAHVFRRVNR